MGEQNVQRDDNERSHQSFMQSLLTEVRAHDRMLATGMIESSVRRIGAEQEVSINGIDRLSIKHDNVLLEVCNTSFQVHFQVGAEEFAQFYSIAQVITAPLLAAASNSPILLGRRLWHETRIAVFENSVDTRSTVHQARGQHPRVHFGDRWSNESVTGT